MDAATTHLLLTVAKVLHHHAGVEHKADIEAAVEHWPHAKAFLHGEADPNTTKHSEK